MQIQISWLLQKPNDLDLHCLQKQGISGFSRTRVKILSGMANSVDPNWSSLIWVCTVCICHFVGNFGVQKFRTFTIYTLAKALSSHQHFTTLIHEMDFRRKKSVWFWSCHEYPLNKQGRNIMRMAKSKTYLPAPLSQQFGIFKKNH